MKDLPPGALQAMALQIGSRFGIAPELVGAAAEMLLEGKSDRVSVQSAILVNRRLDSLDDQAFRTLFSTILENPQYSSLHDQLYRAIFETVAVLAKKG